MIFCFSYYSKQNSYEAPSLREDVYPSWKNEIDSFRQSTNTINEPNLIRTVSFSSGFEENDISDDVAKTPFKWAFLKQKKKRHHSNKG